MSAAEDDRGGGGGDGSKSGADRPKNAGGAQRRTWNLEEYEERARLRAELGDEALEGDVDDRPVRDREEFRKADTAAAGPAGSSRAFLKRRETQLHLSKAAGKIQMITDNGLRQKAGGWYCDVCECLLKDSANYLDHINGKKHQRKLGFSMRVERSSVCQVTDRFKQAKKRKEEEARGTNNKPTAMESYEARIQEAMDQEVQRKRAKKEAKLAKKQEQQALEMEGADPDIAAMMGFSSFGK